MPQIINYNGKLARISQKNKSVIEESPNGSSWIPKGSIDGSFRAILQVGNMVIAAASDGIYRSPNLLSWSKISSENGIMDMTIMNNNIWAVSEDGKSLCSHNGFSWIKK